MEPSVIGVWQMIRAELSGESAPELVTAKTTIELCDGQYLVRYAGQVVDRGTFELGAAIECPTFVLHGKEGPNAGRSIPCLYQLRGDRLRVCYGLDGTAPDGFATVGGDQRYLAVYRRTG